MYLAVTCLGKTDYSLSLSLSLSENKILLFCFFVCLEFIVPLENFSLILRRHHCRWSSANFNLCSALMAIEQWGFFSVPHPMRLGPTLYNCHLRGTMTLTPVAERLAVELSQPVFTTKVCRDRGSNPDLPHTNKIVKSISNFDSRKKL